MNIHIRAATDANLPPTTNANGRQKWMLKYKPWHQSGCRTVRLECARFHASWYAKFGSKKRWNAPNQQLNRHHCLICTNSPDRPAAAELNMNQTISNQRARYTSATPLSTRTILLTRFDLSTLVHILWNGLIYRVVQSRISIFFAVSLQWGRISAN